MNIDREPLGERQWLDRCEAPDVAPPSRWNTSLVRRFMTCCSCAAELAARVNRAGPRMAGDAD